MRSAKRYCINYYKTSILEEVDNLDNKTQVSPLPLPPLSIRKLAYCRAIKAYKGYSPPPILSDNELILSAISVSALTIYACLIPKTLY